MKIYVDADGCPVVDISQNSNYSGLWIGHHVLRQQGKYIGKAKTIQFESDRNFEKYLRELIEARQR